MKYAICTLAANKEFIQGALNLYYSYNNLELPYDFVIMMPIYLKDPGLPDRPNLKYYYYEQDLFFTRVTVERHKTTFNKFQAFNLTEYDKVLFLDADMILCTGSQQAIVNIFSQDVKIFRVSIKVIEKADKIVDFENHTLYQKENLKQNFKVCGQYILFKPNKIYFTSLFKYLLTAEDDEMLMYNEISSIKDFSLFMSNLSIYHDSYFPKYWQQSNCPNWEQFISNIQNSHKIISRASILSALKELSHKKRYAYCTLVTKEKYIQGALNLYYSLQAVHTAYDFIILIPEELKTNLSQFNIKTYIINNISFFNGNYKDSICKLYAYSLTYYNKVMFIDADALVYKNPDYLFDLSDQEFIGTKNYFNNIDRSQDTNWFIWATIFIVKPDLSFQKKFFNQNILSSYTNEEDVLMDTLNFNKVYLTDELKVPLIHFCGQPKYWEPFRYDFNWRNFINYIISTTTNYKTQYNEKAPLIDMLRLFYDNYLCFKNGDPDIQN